MNALLVSTKMSTALKESEQTEAYPDKGENDFGNGHACRSRLMNRQARQAKQGDRSQTEVTIRERYYAKRNKAQQDILDGNPA